MDKKEYRKLSELKNWENNPRTITKDGMERLKKQIQKLGQYKPLLITDDGTVLGGNMRLRAYQDLQTENIWVSVVDAPTEEKKIEYALSDNDRIGQYDKDMLANMVGNFPDVEWKDFSVDLEPPVMVDDLIEKFSEGEIDEQYAGLYQIVIECVNEIEQKEHYDKLNSLGYKCKVLTI